MSSLFPDASENRLTRLNESSPAIFSQHPSFVDSHEPKKSVSNDSRPGFHTRSKKSIPDGIVEGEFFKKCSSLFFLGKRRVKSEKMGSDPSTQAAGKSVKPLLGPVQGKYASSRCIAFSLTSFILQFETLLVCPTFLSLPRFTILGSVVTDDEIVQRLTDYHLFWFRLCFQ